MEFYFVGKFWLTEKLTKQFGRSWKATESKSVLELYNSSDELEEESY